MLPASANRRPDVYLSYDIFRKLYKGSRGDQLYRERKTEARCDLR